MRNLARRQEHQQHVSEDVGTVARIDGADFVIETDAGELRARRATSCLLEPAPGDLVLVALVSRGSSYVLAVLEREAGAPGHIVADGDLNITLGRGSLGVAAQGDVRLVSGREVSVVSGGLRVNAVDGSVVLERLSFLGTFFQAEIERAKLLGKSLDTLLERVSQRVKRSYRVVEESDHVRAESIDYAAKTSMSLHAQNTLLTAEELVKLEGEQIHLG
jgi:Protein of unknown function (DUF3540)